MAAKLLLDLPQHRPHFFVFIGQLPDFDARIRRSRLHPRVPQVPYDMTQRSSPAGYRNSRQPFLFGILHQVAVGELHRPVQFRPAGFIGQRDPYVAGLAEQADDRQLQRVKPVKACKVKGFPCYGAAGFPQGGQFFRCHPVKSRHVIDIVLNEVSKIFPVNLCDFPVFLPVRRGATVPVGEGGVDFFRRCAAAADLFHHRGH